MGIQRGEPPPQFDVLFEKYYKPLVSYGARLTGSYEVAEDLATDAFVVLHDRPERWEPEDVARRLLYHVVHNSAIDLLRVAKIHERLLHDDVTVEHNDIPGTAEASPSPTAWLEREELLQALDDAIQALPEKRRTVVTLRLEQALRNKEIAEILGMTLKAIDLHLSLAMRDLHHVLDRFEEEDR